MSRNAKGQILPGTPPWNKGMKKSLHECEVDGCINSQRDGGTPYCNKHFLRFKRYGDVNYVTPARPNKGSFRVGREPWNKGTTGLIKPNAGTFGIKDVGDEKHPQWKGVDATYVAAHLWIARKLGKSKLCENCGTTDAKRFEWANISGKYLRDVSDWVRLCSICHHLIDDIAGRGSRTKANKKVKILA